ncbi:hypothetical protein CNMCM5793_002407 [Aspergillus hiratsukae]|uniref:Zn(2)-C6 fungal-type domain-containing protein n=1 Tax=Aspergillus hiratsukae TaxID=1194566 RepID=A0A8H6UP92_9EURO|nr:hypothetical protein CNMCM5793_002407 [Aspergillus hiratsukae]KAF7162088.1 hypothetical protein CNMCM6106_009125 [Aspergillus hiratsukae]
MPTSKSSKVSKPSRITVACNSCRSRKQKCSGNNSNGWFPGPGGRTHKAHQARGPAKGYIEALEHRLRETEHVLLRLLAHMADEQLSIAVERDQSLSQRRYSTCQRSGKDDVQYWRRYPLHTARDLREWQQDCLAETGAPGPPMTSPSRRTEVSAQPEVEAEESSPVASESQQIDVHPVPHFEQVTGAHEVRPKSTQVTHGKGTNQWEAWKHGYDPSSELRESPTTGGFVYVPSSLESTQLQDTAPLHVGTPPGPSLWSEAPSVAFQRQFLW